MITLNGRQYNVTFVGDCDIDFSDPVAGSVLTVDAFGLDSLERPYKVRIDRKTVVQGQLSRLKGKQDFEFKTMALTGWTEREEGPFVVFTVTFKGLFDNKIPNPKFSGGFSLQRGTSSMTGATLAGLPALQGASVDIEYLAPFTTVKYVRRERPTQPQFANDIITGDIIYQSVDGESTGIINIYATRNQFDGDRPQVAQNGRYNMKKVVQIKGPTWEQVGLWYECQETHEMILQPFDMQSRLAFI
jgi:hypothetical protein